MSLLLILLTTMSQATDFTEASLISRIQETNTYKAQQAEVQGQLNRSQITQAQFQPQLQSSINYGESKEDPLFQFSPVVTLSRSSTVGVAQKLPIGVSAKIEGFTDQISMPAFDVNRVNRTGVRAQIEVDLLSNFLGRRDGSDFKSSRVQKKVADLRSTLDRHSLAQEMRKVYWSYMGLEESYKMAEVLLGSAQKQMQEIQARRKVGAADESDLARSQSQVAARKTQLSVIEFQKSQLLQQLKMQYSDLSGLPYVETAKALTEVYDCVKTIQKSPDYTTITDYTQMVDLLLEEKKYVVRQAKTTADWDLKLKGQYQQNAVDQGFSDSQERFLNQPKEAFQVGLQLGIPLGSKLNKAEKHAVSQAEQGYDSRVGQIQQSIITQHGRALKSLELLSSAVGTQEQSVQSLRTSVNSAKRKYSQARISQIEYILEQDKLFNTEIETIQTRLQVIHETLDYLKIFNKQQCLFNKKVGA